MGQTVTAETATESPAARAARLRSQAVAHLAKAPRKRRRGAVEPQHSDHGAELALARKLVEVRETFLEHEPGNRFAGGRLGTQAKRGWVVERLSMGRNPAVQPHQYDAGVRFYDDFLIGEMGARPGGGGSTTRLDPWARLPFSEQQAARRESFRAAVRQAGEGFGSILTWCVLQYTDSPATPPTVQTWAKREGWRTDRATGFLVGALEALAQHYGYTRSNSPSVRRVARRLRQK